MALLAVKGAKKRQIHALYLITFHQLDKNPRQAVAQGFSSREKGVTKRRNSISRLRLSNGN